MERNEPGLFGASLESASKPNYLGSRQVVEAVVRLSVSRMIEEFAKAKDPASRQAVLQKEAKEVGDILIGDNSDYTPLHKWNEPGAIDEFSAKWLGSAETDPNGRMEHCMVKLYNEVLDIAEYANKPGVLEEQWDWQIGAIIDRYVSVFMGIDLPTQASLVLTDEEEKEDVSVLGE